VTPSHTFDQTDQLILYLVKNLTKGVPQLLLEGGGVLTTMLAKLLFLIDVWSMQTAGSQATDFRYVRYKFGPYPLAQFQERLERLEPWGLYATPNVSIEEGKPYRIYRLTKGHEARLDLSPAIKLLADEVMTTFANQTLGQVLIHVYGLECVQNTAFGEAIDLESLRPKQDILQKVLRVFRDDLSAGLSEQHEAVLKEANKEASNENVELARAMAEKQRRAFRLKHGS